MSDKECACGCGQPLLHRHPSTKYHSRLCAQRAYSAKRNPIRPFVALDGEGENDKSGGHFYNLLASGNGKWIGRKTFPGLSTEECLNFLLDLPRGQSGGTRPIYVWFAFDYDVNMMLKDIPLKGRNSIETLRETNTVYWRGYRITYIRRKIFRVARGVRRHSSYDVWGFFQSSFENALASWGIEIPEIISKGKASRSGFRYWPLHRIRDYNQAELSCLENLTEKLRDSITPLELPIQSWHGPAALAGAWLRKNRVLDWLPVSKLPAHLEMASACAYSGGRIDVQGYGIVDPVYHYDIVSAYPAAIAELPNLCKLTWRRQEKGEPCGRLYVSRIRWRDIDETYWPPFPWRSSNGSIRYPPKGEGWYWKPEIDAAIKRFGPERFTFMESWIAEGEYETPFYDLIHDAFRYRGELKRQGHPSHVAVKLILNSLYGKFAQTVGRASYFSPIWAGLITAQTRAKLQSVLTDDVVCMMTDSIWSRKPLSITPGTGLGDWEIQDENRLVLAEAGLYEAYTPDGSKAIWQRGFDKRNPIDVEHVVRQWLDADPSYRPTYSVTRFIGMGLASMTHYPWRSWISIDRVIEPVPLVGTTKRLPYYPHEMGERIGDFISLHPRPRDEAVCGYPYSKITNDISTVIARLQDECSDD